MYTYSGAPAGLDASLTALQVHHLMKTPTLLARRFKSIVDEKFIADYLLTGRYKAVGGAIAYPASDLDIYPKDVPEAVAPGSQYPLTQMDSGQLAIAATLKRALATHVFDEEIARMLLNPVNDAFTFLGNAIVKAVDGAALGVIASKVTATYSTAATPWTGANAARGIVTSIRLAKAQMSALKLGLTPDTVVLTEAQFEQAMAELLLAGILPRENGNPIVSGSWPEVLGVTWTTSPNVPFTDPFLVDRTQLGGMADEDIPSPEFSKAGNVELSSERLQGRDGYEVRTRRVTVPVVLRPSAGVRITGTGL